MERMNAWFAEQRPGMGETVIEAHPGIYLPRGSITKVLGHEFDVVRCGGGLWISRNLRGLSARLGWGVAAWVQWRHLKVSLEGLQPSVPPPASACL